VKIRVLFRMLFGGTDTSRARVSLLIGKEIWPKLTGIHNG